MHNNNTTYFEIDKRHQLTLNTLKVGLSENYATNYVKNLLNLNCYIKHVRISLADDKILTQIT